MAKVANNIRIYGGLAGGVFVAPKGTAAPTDLGALNAAFKEVGWIDEKGIEGEQKAESKEFKGWQGGATVKYTNTGVKRSFKFTCLEENALVFGLAYPDTTMTVTGTGAAAIAKGTIPNSLSTVERHFVFDAVDSTDSTIRTRYSVPVGVIDASTKQEYKVDGVTLYEFTVNVMSDMTIITNSPGIVAP